MTMFHGKRRLTTEQVRDVVRRAELLDRHDMETISEEELRSIASDLGISEMALHRALATIPTVVESVPIWKRPASVAVSAWLGGAAAAIALSLISGPLPHPYLAYTTLGTLIGLTCVSASLGFEAKTSIAQRRFQLGNLALWSGWGFTTATFGHYEVAIPGFVIGAAAALVGWLANRSSTSSEQASDVGGSPGIPPQDTAKAGWRAKLADWIRRDVHLFGDILPAWVSRG